MMSSVMSPASADEALEMLTAAMGDLARADATTMTAEEQARACGRGAATSVGTVAGPRSGRVPTRAGYSATPLQPAGLADPEDGVTKGAGVAIRVGAAGRRTTGVLAALATGDLPESVARILCQWINRLPEDKRDLAEEKLVAAALAKMSLQDLAELYGETTSRPGPHPRRGQRRGIDDGRCG